MSGARTRPGTNPFRRHLKDQPLGFSPSRSRRTWKTCDRETGLRRKCRKCLVIAKVGGSPTLGGAGKPRNECDTCGQARCEKGAHRADGEAPDGSG
jgi:hypothetical protein